MLLKWQSHEELLKAREVQVIPAFSCIFCSCLWSQGRTEKPPCCLLLEPELMDELVGRVHPGLT